MTNLEAFKAKIADYATNPVLLGAMRRLCAHHEAMSMRDYSLRELTDALMDGVTAYDELDVSDIQELLTLGIEPDDSEDAVQIEIEDIDQELEEWCTAARTEAEAALDTGLA